MLAEVERAVRSSGNAQVIGRNGELPLLRFLERHLPYTLRPLTGHFVAPSGELSPQLDVMIVDARYPLLAQNLDGSAVVMLHSLLCAIEVKTTLTIPELQSTWKKTHKCRQLEEQLATPEEAFFVRHHLFAYRTTVRLETLENRYSVLSEPEIVGLDVTVLRLAGKDQLPESTVGVELHFEPPHPEDLGDGGAEYDPTCRASYTPLSDLYYDIVQMSYYSLFWRDYSYGNIGAHFNDYMTWTTCHWDIYHQSDAERVSVPAQPNHPLVRRERS